MRADAVVPDPSRHAHVDRPWAVPETSMQAVQATDLDAMLDRLRAEARFDWSLIRAITRISDQ
jgi:hypothetical protein